jgi:hypothetical protein
MFASLITLGAFNLAGRYYTALFFARRADHRAARKFPLYHTRRLFVKQKFAQIFFFKTPEICAYFSKIFLAFPLAIPYNNTCKEQGNIQQ